MRVSSDIYIPWFLPTLYLHFLYPPLCADDVSGTVRLKPVPPLNLNTLWQKEEYLDASGG